MRLHIRLMNFSLDCSSLSMCMVIVVQYMLIMDHLESPVAVNLESPNRVNFTDSRNGVSTYLVSACKPTSPSSL